MSHHSMKSVHYQLYWRNKTSILTLSNINKPFFTPFHYLAGHLPPFGLRCSLLIGNSQTLFHTSCELRVLQKRLFWPVTGLTESKKPGQVRWIFFRLTALASISFFDDGVYRPRLVLPALIPLLPVEFPDPLHILFAQFEIKDIVVLCNMLRIGRARDSDKTGLQMPPKDDLRR